MNQPSAIEPIVALDEVRWVRDLARSLVVDEHLAEDVAQDALLAAIERDHSTGRASRGWLAHVVRNALRMAARSAGHRRSREELAARRESVSAADEVLSELETHQRLMLAVSELAPRHREVIVWRYLRGETPREIARRLDLDAETVSNRLQNALRKLRARLDREFGARATWMGLFTPFFSLPSTQSISLGVCAVKSKLFAIVSLAVLGTVAFVVWNRSDVSRAERAEETPLSSALHSTARAENDAPHEPSIDRRDVDVPREPALEREISSAPKSTLAFTFRGRVFDATGTALPGVRVGCEGDDTTSGSISALGGWFELTSRAERARIASLDPRWLTVANGVFRSDASMTPIVVVAPTIECRGFVQDSSGNRLSGARVGFELPAGFSARFDESLEGSQELSWRRDTDRAGLFAFDAVPAIDGARLRVVLDGYEPHEEQAPVADTFDWMVTLVSPKLPTSGVLRGRVVDVTRHAVPKARVALGLTSTLCDDEGRFELDLKRAVTTDTLRAIKEGFLPAMMQRPFSERADDGGWPQDVELVLPGAALSIAGRVVDDEGSPIVGACISIADPTPFGVIGMMPTSLEGLASGAVLPPEALASQRMLPDSDGDRFWDFHQRPAKPTAFWNYVRTDASGRFELTGLDARDYRVQVFDDSTLTLFESRPIRAGTLDAKIEFRGPATWERVAGRVVDDEGAGVANVTLALTCEVYGVRARVFGGSVYVTMRQHGATARTDADGRFSFSDVPQSKLILDVNGESIVPRPYELTELADPLAVSIVVDLRCPFEIVLDAPLDRADRASAHDASGATIDLLRIRENSVNANTDCGLDNGRSGVLFVSSKARLIRLWKGEQLIAELPIRLRPGDTTSVRW